MDAPSRLSRWPLGRLPTIRLRGFTPKRPRPDYCQSCAGQDALAQLLTLSQPEAETLLSLCAAALSLYPAWERQSWVMPDPDAALQVHGGAYLELDALALRLGGVRHLAGRHSYLHAATGLAFAAHQDALGRVTLVLGGTNSSHTDSQPRTFPAEVQQLRADVLNVMGRIPRLYRAADLLTLLLRDELALQGGGHRLTLTGHSLGGGLAQYAGLMNGTSVLAFSPTALGRGLLTLLADARRLDDPSAVLAQIRSYSLDGDPIPLLGTTWLSSCVVGQHFRLPLAAEVPPARYATSHGQMYPHLVAHLRHNWPELPDAIERKAEGMTEGLNPEQTEP
jgi:hypothetical protein